MPRQRILSHIILGILSTSQEMVTGKFITDYFHKEIGEFWQAAHSQIYPELKRMTEDGWISCHPVPNNDKEKQYKLAKKGRSVLEEWLALPNEERPQHRDFFSLKMFFVQQMDDKRIPVLIKGQIELLEEHLRHLEGRKELLFSEQSAIETNYGHYLILTRAIARNKREVEWLRQNLADWEKRNI